MATVVTEKVLQQTLVNLIDLSLQAKQAHWNIRGENFHSLHLQLDDITEQVRTNYDDVAERLVALGAVADGRSSDLVASSTIGAIDAGVLETGKVYRVMEEKLMTISNYIKENLDAVDAEDHLSNDLLIGIATDLEKSAWMLRAASE